MSHLRREFTKILLQKRTYFGWGGLFLVPILVSIAVYFSPGSGGQGGEGQQDADLFAFVSGNGLYVTMASLFALSAFLLPLLAAMAGSQTLAGEAEKGTLRTVLMQPVRRGAVLIAKWVVANLYIVVGLALLLVSSLAAGAAFFGLKPLLLLNADPMSYDPVSVGYSIWLIFLAYLFVVAAMAAAVSLALLFSTLTDSGLTAVVAAMVVMIILIVLGNLSSLAFMKPYLFTGHFTDWTDLFRDPIEWDAMRDALICFAAWLFGTTGLAWLFFRRKDIHS
jgi:ABC-2 type transport system permease protein